VILGMLHAHMCRLMKPACPVLRTSAQQLQQSVGSWCEYISDIYPSLHRLLPCSQDFLNGVCTHIIWLTQRKLTYYTGETHGHATICSWLAVVMLFIARLLAGNIASHAATLLCWRGCGLHLVGLGC
jgi:hypothetical protein